MAFDAVIGLRVPAELKARFQRLARQPENRGRDVADLMRIAIEDYVEAWEKKLGIKPITEEELAEFNALLAAERFGKTITPAKPPKGPVTYRKGTRAAKGTAHNPKPFAEG